MYHHHNNSSTYYYMYLKNIAEQKRAAAANRKQANKAAYASLSASVLSNPGLSESERAAILGKFQRQVRLQEENDKREIQEADDRASNYFCCTVVFAISVPLIAFILIGVIVIIIVVTKKNKK